MATARCPCLGLGDGPVDAETFFHFILYDDLEAGSSFSTFFFFETNPGESLLMSAPNHR